MILHILIMGENICSNDIRDIQYICIGGDTRAQERLVEKK